MKTKKKLKISMFAIFTWKSNADEGNLRFLGILELTSTVVDSTKDIVSNLLERELECMLAELEHGKASTT